MFDKRILSALQWELDNAKQRHQAATERFRELRGSRREYPGSKEGVPEADGRQMLRNAISEETRARDLHLSALLRMNEYLLNGTVPDHLKSAPPDEQ